MCQTGTPGLRQWTWPERKLPGREDVESIGPRLRASDPIDLNLISRVEQGLDKSHGVKFRILIICECEFTFILEHE
jgi:hypothetical protein